jgi:hypothetical protein
MTGKIHWRCFHCDETFTKDQHKWAQQHFGVTEAETPVCLMRVPGEHHLLERLRRQEHELAAYRAEDTDLHRAILSMECDHRTALIREEEKGYARGLSDALDAQVPTPPAA